MRRKTAQRRGLAMLLVLSVVGLVAVLGLAMLSEAALRANMAQASRDRIAADGLAESGLDLACYYLIKPHMAGSFTGDYWPGQSGISLGADVPGTIDVGVIPLGGEQYEIISTGRIDNLSRTTRATVHASPGFRVKYPVAIQRGTTRIEARTTVHGDVWTGEGPLENGGWIRGRAVCESYTPIGSGRVDGGIAAPIGADAYRFPDEANLRDYGTYTYRGQSYSATTLFSDRLYSGTVLRSTASNPAGVYRRKGNLTIYGDVTVLGTLIVDGGTLTIAGQGNQIWPMESFPGLIVSGSIVLQNSLYPRSLLVNGIVWCKGDIRSSGTVDTCSLTINGALLLAGSSKINLDHGRVDVYFNPAKCELVDLDTTVPPAGVKVLSFRQ